MKSGRYSSLSTQPRVTTRRAMLRSSAAGFGSLALTGMLAQQNILNAAMRSEGSGHLQQLHFPQRARRIIFLFMWGGPSHVDLFDPKPRLNRDHGQPISAEATGSKKQNRCRRQRARFAV